MFQCSMRTGQQRERAARRAGKQADATEADSRAAAVGDGASEAPGEHVFGSDHHGELLYGCGLSDKGCTTTLLCQ